METILTNPIEHYHSATDEAPAQDVAAEYISISAFAELAGVTPQAIYKRLNKDLNPYLIVEDGVKLISLNALTLFTTNPSNNTQTRQNKQIAALEEENRRLTEELNRVRKLYEAQTEKALALMESQVSQYNEVCKLLIQSNQLNERLLSAKTGLDNPLSKPIECTNSTNESLDNRLSKHKKQSFFSRLFSKR